MKKYPIPETAITRLISNAAEDSAENRSERALLLGDALWRIIDRLNADPETLVTGDDNDHCVCATPPIQIAPKIETDLTLFVPRQFDEAIGTQEWLEHTSSAELRLLTFDQDPSIDTRSDYTESSTVVIKPVVYSESSLDNRSAPYLANTIGGVSLPVPDIETTITLLSLIADELPQN